MKTVTYRADLYHYTTREPNAEPRSYSETITVADMTILKIKPFLFQRAATIFAGTGNGLWTGEVPDAITIHVLNISTLDTKCHATSRKHGAITAHSPSQHPHHTTT